MRYSWTAGAGSVLCIMLDHPDPYHSSQHIEQPQVILSQETLAFLAITLENFPDRPTVIFSHCPLRATVLQRNAERKLDNDSQDVSFYVENSEAVRAILAHSANEVLFMSGHTHSGWGSPHLVFTEVLGNHSVTHLNLMSPWYTGRHCGPRRVEGSAKFMYAPDDPNLLVSFAVRFYQHYATIQAREHHTRRWLAQWQVPLHFWHRPEERSGAERHQ